MAEIKDLINKINKVGYDGLSDSEYESLKSLPKPQRDILNKVNTGTFDALSQPEYDALKSFVAPAPKAAPQAAAQPAPRSSWERFLPSPLAAVLHSDPAEAEQDNSPHKQTMRAIMPSSMAAAENDADFMRRAATGARDALTLVPRITAGVGGAIADLAAGRGTGSAATAMLQGMQDPSSLLDITPDNRVGQVIQTAATEAAKDPMTLPLAYFGIGNGLLNTVLRGGALGAATYGTHAADRYIAGRDDVLSGETGGQLLADVLPAGAPVVTTVGAKVLPHIPIVGAIPNMVKAAYGAMGEPGKELAYKLATSIVKPLPAHSGGQVAEGFQSGLRDVIDLGAGPEPIFPKLINQETHSVGDVYKNYLNLREQVDAGFNPAIAALDQAGVTVPPRAITEAVTEHMRKARVGSVPSAGEVGAMTKAEMDKAVGEVRDLVEKHHDNLPMQDITDAFRTGNPSEYPIPHHYRLTGKGGKITILTPQEYSAKLAKGTIEAAQSRTDIQKEFVRQMREAGHPQDMIDNLFPHSKVGGVEPVYEFPVGTGEGKLKPMERAFDYDPMTAGRAAQLKTSAQKEAYKRSAEQSLPREEALRKTGEELKAWLTDPYKARAYEAQRIMNPTQSSQYTPEQLMTALKTKQALEARMKAFGKSAEELLGEPSTSKVAAHAQYAKQLENAAPIYRLETALERADRVAANRDPLGLAKATVNWLTDPAKAFQASAQRDPAMARLIYDYANATGGIKNWLTQPGALKPIVDVNGVSGLLRSASRNLLEIPAHDKLLVPASKFAGKVANKASEVAGTGLTSAQVALLKHLTGRSATDNTKTAKKGK